jgi:hypothetical protein
VCLGYLEGEGVLGSVEGRVRPQASDNCRSQEKSVELFANQAHNCPASQVLHGGRDFPHLDDVAERAAPTPDVSGQTPPIRTEDHTVDFPPGLLEGEEFLAAGGVSHSRSVPSSPPLAECTTWQQLWADVEKLLQKTRESTK